MAGRTPGVAEEDARRQIPRYRAPWTPREASQGAGDGQRRRDGSEQQRNAGTPKDRPRRQRRRGAAAGRRKRWVEETEGRRRRRQEGDRRRCRGEKEDLKRKEEEEGTVGWECGKVLPSRAIRSTPPAALRRPWHAPAVDRDGRRGRGVGRCPRCAAAVRPHCTPVRGPWRDEAPHHGLVADRDEGRGRGEGGRPRRGCPPCRAEGRRRRGEASGRGGFFLRKVRTGSDIYREGTYGCGAEASKSRAEPSRSRQKQQTYRKKHR